MVFAGFTRITGIPTSEEARSEVYNVSLLPRNVEDLIS
jgi:hypothetical protein